MWHVVSSHTALLPSRFREKKLILTRALSGVDTLPQRWISCVGRTEGAFPYVTGAMYIEDRFSSQEKEEVRVLVKISREVIISWDFDLLSTRRLPFTLCKEIKNCISLSSIILNLNIGRDTSICWQTHWMLWTLVAHDFRIQLNWVCLAVPILSNSTKD